MEVTPTKSERTGGQDRAAARVFKEFFGSDLVVRTLSRTDFDRFVRERLSGRAGHGKGAVRPRTVEYDLRLLKAVFNWALVAGDGQGGVLLDRNPLNGFKMPREKNPVRVVLGEGEYRALLEAAFGLVTALARARNDPDPVHCLMKSPQPGSTEGTLVTVFISITYISGASRDRTGDLLVAKARRGLWQGAMCQECHSMVPTGYVYTAVPR